MKSAFAVVACCWLMLIGAAPEPTDSALIRAVRMHRAEFEAVRRMALAEHGIERIAPDFVRSTTGIMTPPVPGHEPSADRIRRYRELFRRIGAVGGIGFSRTRVYFYMYDTGLAGQGTSKGIVWTTDPPAPLRPNLDLLKSAARPIGGFRRIAPDWYLEYEAD